MNPQRVKTPINQNINPEEGKSLLAQGAGSLGVSLSPLQFKQFWDYLVLLQKWNQKINLTALHSPKEIILKHFLDSLSPLPCIPEDVRIMDLGSGAGFPGLPIKICRPHQSVTLIEASSKKASFLKEVIRQLNLKKIQVLEGFLGKEPFPQLQDSQFDIITTRAVGKLKDLISAVSLYLPQGGKLMLMKGPQGHKEVMDLEVVINKKGFQIAPPVHLTLPFLNQERVLIFLTKWT